MPKTTNPLVRRKSSSASPFKKPASPSPRKTSLPLPSDGEDRLGDTGLIPSIAPPGVNTDVESLIRYILAHTWSNIPDRAGGMGSERISEVLRFREALPGIASIAHLHAISASSTQTERELARLVAGGEVRKVTIPGRGKGGASIGEGVMLASDWKSRVTQEQTLGEEVKEKFMQLLDEYPTSAAAPTSPLLSHEEVQELVKAGFLTSPSAGLSSNLSSLFAPPGTSFLNTTLASSGTKAATGTFAAVGGQDAIHSSGAGSTTLNRSVPSPSRSITQHMTFSLPSTGPYLKLLTTARQHLLALLKQLSPRYREATLELLKEKWDGNIPNDAASRMKRARGEWSGVLPGKTRKWKEFFGLEFDWILAECVGSGLVELFDTGSVGLAVRGT